MSVEPKAMNLENWNGCERPGLSRLVGAYAVCEPYERADHLQGLFGALGGAGNDHLWTFMPIGPFAAESDLGELLSGVNGQLGWQTMVIRCAASNEILGMASYMRIRCEHGSAEVGAVTFSKKLQRSRIATDAMFVMAKHVFEDLGYRRYEWKCNNANGASKRAAERFGFQYEGVFRNDMVTKGQNRDTAWYAMIDSDWSAIQKAFNAWLAQVNFDGAGQQKSCLAALRAG